MSESNMQTEINIFDDFKFEIFNSGEFKLHFKQY